jgi:hypothetical protein
MDRLNTPWRKSSYSAANGGDCIEIANAPGTVLVRDSKHPDGPRLAFRPRAWEAFAATLKAGPPSA